MVALTRHRDPYRAFFTADEALGGYMASLLNLNNADTLFEPAAGDGHLIDAARNIAPHIPITAYELHPKHASNLRCRFQASSKVDVLERDTIFCPDLDLRESFGPKFSKILANPPYGGWQEQGRRAELKKRFQGLYVRETYTLFLIRCLRLLSQGGRLVFIIPDTFLYLHLHAPIRKMILKEYSLESIDLFRSCLFPGISFGYANLCIICISNHKPIPQHSVRLRFVDNLADFSCQSHLNAKSSFVIQKDVLNTDNCAIPLSPNQAMLENSAKNGVTMANIANCVTGFYSGNDKTFLRRASEEVKRSSGYKLIDRNLLEEHPSLMDKPTDGIEGKRSFIPILKGGGYNFIKPSMWFIDWSKSAVSHYKTDKKARFQNSSYYFKTGIGFPMVTSTRPTAAIIQDSLFDQSIVGIFPHIGVSFEFLLAYCNSLPFWVCLKTINPSANNSSKYILRTPIILPEQNEQEWIEKRTKELIQILRHGEAGSKLLMNEILHSIVKYVKKKASQKELEPTTNNAVSIL